MTSLSGVYSEYSRNERLWNVARPLGDAKPTKAGMVRRYFCVRAQGAERPYTIGTEVSARVPSVRFYLLAFAGVVFGANGTMIRTGS